MRRLTCTEDGASKFWEGGVEGTSLTVRWGKIGTAGQTKVKAFTSAAAAEQELAKLVKEKLGKGYADAAAALAGTPAASAPAPSAAAAPAKAETYKAKALEPKPAKPVAKPKAKAPRTVLKWGYIDKTGNWVISARFDAARQFQDGLAAVKVGDKWGFADKTGSLAIPAKYSLVENFSHGTTRVSLTGTFFSTNDPCIDRTGNPVPGPLVRLGDGPYPVKALTGPLQGYIDEAHRWVIEPRFESAGSFAEGVAWVKLPGKPGHLIIDREGKTVCETDFERTAPFSDGLARVSRGRKHAGWADATGKLVIDLGEDAPNTGAGGADWNLIWHAGGPFREGLAALRPGTGTAVIDKTGKVLFETDYDRIEPFREGFARVLRRGSPDLWGYVDRAGKVLLQPCLGSAGDFTEGLAYVSFSSLAEPGRSQNWWKGLMDTSGKMVVKGMDNFTGFDDLGMAIASPNDGGKKVGIVFRDGHWLQDVFEKIEPFVGDRALARRDLKWGVIDRQGKWVIEPKYNRVGKLRDLTMVNIGATNPDQASGGKWGYIDTTGTEVIPLQYEAAGGFFDDVAAVASLVEEAADPRDVGKYPFLFYGVAPDDWAEAANLGHTYVARFKATPGAEARAGLAQAFESKLKKLSSRSASGSVRKWTWQDDWVCVAVGEDHAGEVDDFEHSDFFHNIRTAVEALHAASPLDEVVFLGAKGTSGDDWERWTLRMQARPTKWPFPFVALCFRP